MDPAGCRSTNRSRTGQDRRPPGGRQAAPPARTVLSLPPALHPVPTQSLHGILFRPGWPSHAWPNSKHERLWWSCQPQLFAEIRRPGHPTVLVFPSTALGSASSGPSRCGRIAGSLELCEGHLCVAQSQRQIKHCAHQLFCKEHFAAIKYLCAVHT